jgi:lia operon protein LiaF
MRTASQIVVACILLGIGVILLLINLGVVSLEFQSFLDLFYPYVFLLLGVILLIQSLKMHSSSRLFFGLFLTVFSSLLILDDNGILTFHFSDFWSLWPLIFIYIGVKKLLFKKKKKSPKILTYTYSSENGSQHFHSDMDWDQKNSQGKNVLVGNFEFKKSNWSLEPMNLVNAVGNYYIDFSKAFIPDQETPVFIKGRIGDVKIILPEDVPVKIEAFNSIGDIKLFKESYDQIGRGDWVTYISPDYEEATRKIHIRVKLSIGSIRIDRV